MEIRYYLCFYFSLFIILNVSELNASVSQQKNVGKVCGRPKITGGFMFRGKDFKRGEFPWMVAMLNDQKSPVEFFCAGTLVSARHVITGKTQMQKQIFSSFGDKNWPSVTVNFNLSCFF